MHFDYPTVNTQVYRLENAVAQICSFTEAPGTICF